MELVVRPLIFSNFLFGRVWLTQVLSQSGIRMYQIAVVWWIVQSQGALAGKWLAAFAIVSALPPILFAGWIGRHVDSGDPRRFMILADFMSATSVMMAFLMFKFGTPSVVGLGILGFFLSFSQSFFDPALNRSIRGLVGTEDLPRAIGYTASTASFANLFGAVISASLMGFLGVEQVPMITALGYLVSGTVLILTPFRSVVSEPPTSARSSASPLDLTDRAHANSSESMFRFLFLDTAVLNFFTVPVVILLPLMTDRILKGSSSVLAGLEASLFAGFILGTMSSSWAAKKQAIRVSAVALFLLGLSYGVIALGRSQQVIALGLLLAGAFVGLNNARMTTFFHEIFPEEKKGHFFATLNAYCNVAVPLGYAAFGALADIISLNWLVAIEGVGIAFTALWLFLGTSKLRSV